MADAITGGNDIGLWSANIPEKCRNIDWKMTQVLFDVVMESYFWTMLFHNQKRKKLVTEMNRVARTTTAK